MKKNYFSQNIFLIFLFLFLSQFNLNAQVTLDVSGNYKVAGYGGMWWNYQYKPTGSSTYTNSEIIQSSSNSLVKLNPFISWDFRVRYYSSGQPGPWGKEYPINAEYSLILPKSVGYKFDFNSPAIAEGWRGYRLQNTTLDYYNNIEDTSIYTNPEIKNALYMGWESGKGIMLVSPKINDIATDKKCSIYAYGRYGDYQLIIGTITNPYDSTTFHPLKTAVASSSGNTIEVFFNNYNSQDQYIAIKSSGTRGDVFLDDFSYEQSVNCFDLKNVAISDIQQNIVQLNFDAPNQDNFEVAVKNLRTGLTETFITNKSPFVISNLSGDTNYEAKVRANCALGLYTNWSQTLLFTTICETVQSGYTTTFGETTYIDPCWKTITNHAKILQDNPNFQVYKPEPRTGDKMIVMSQLSEAPSADQKSYLITPYISDLDNTKRIKFFHVSYGSGEYNTNSLIIGTMSNPNDETTFIPLKTISASEMNEIDGFQKLSGWKEHIVFFDNYDNSNNHHYIALKQNNLQQSVFYIDDFTYEDIPECTEPLNPKVIDFDFDYATVTWENYKTSNSTDWQIEYGPKGFSHGTGTSIEVSSFPFKITNAVLDDTEYDFYVRSKCGSSYSDWSDKGYFKTKCSGVNVGYTTDFENEKFEVNTCWARITPKINRRYWAPSTFVNTSAQQPSLVVEHSGENSILILNELNAFSYYAPQHSISDEIILVSPRLKGFDNYKKISFWMYSDPSAYSSPYEIVVGTLSDNDDYTTFKSYATITSAVNNEGKWIKYEIDFSNYYGTDKYIGIKQNEINRRQLIYIDDFEYLENQCPKPTLLMASQVGENTVSLSWQDNNINNSTAGWTIEYGPLGFTEGTGTIINVKANATNVSGLATNFEYEYKVRTNCNANSTSIWSDRYSFRMACAVTAPFVENFDQYKPYGNGIPDFCWTYNNHENNRLLEYNLNNINSAPYVFSLDDDSGFDGETNIAYLISPYLSDFDKNKKIKFLLFSELSAAKTTNLIIGTIKNPLDLSTFEPYETISYDEIRKTPLYGKEFNIDFSKYNGTNKQIAFKFESNSGPYLNSNRVLIDDIHYDQTLSCYEPIDIVFSNINNNSALINWTSKNQLPQNVQIEYGLVGFTKGTGVKLNTTSNEIKVSNLQVGSSYEFYFKTTCDSGNSIDVGPRKIETTCNIKTVPWIEKFSNSSAYGANLVPDCFKLIDGDLMLENKAKSEVYSNYEPDYIRKGFDDNSYLYFRNDFWTQIMTPMFHLNAGTTYKFSLKARKGYEYAYQSVGLSVGKGQNNYNIETRLTCIGSLTEYNYSNLSYYFTPLTSGDYSFLMDFSSPGGLNLIADNFELREANDTTENLSIVDNEHTDFKYYPNPVENVLNIESNFVISNIEIFNNNGQLIFKGNYSEFKVTIDFKNYPTGVYLINVNSEDKKKTFKVIKK